MARQRLVIDRDDKGHFFLSLDGGVITIGDRPQDAELFLRHLHIGRVHCEIEVEEKSVLVQGAKAPLGQSPLHKELQPGESVKVGHSELRLEGLAGAAGTAGTAVPVAPTPPPASSDEGILGFADDLRLEPVGSRGLEAASAAVATEAAAEQLVKQLVVVDGGDRGRVFLLPDTGICTIGKSSRHADIVLHDLYVARIHCELQVQGDSVRVVHVEGRHGTLIDGQRVTEQVMQVGSVLRVGNSHMRLEAVPRAEAGASQAKKDTQLDIRSDASSVDKPAEDIVEVNDVEIVEDIVEAVDAEAPDTSPSEQGEAYALPHSPIDQLLKLEDQTLAHFKIGQLLGRGQTGLVFCAEEVNTKQSVALKVLSPDFPADDAELQRFVQALKILPQLVHPNLVTLLRAGRTGPYCWIAREYVDGEGLNRLTSRLQPGSGVDWKQVCRILVHVGRALQFLHGHKVTHGNITPRNILLAKNKTAKLADLMLVRALQGSRLHSMIVPKKLLAEAAFLAPEQTVAKGAVTPQTDIYALGAVAYNLLTGRPPFTGRTLQEITTNIREAKLVRPAKHHPEIPAPFEAIVLTMLARRPQDRLQRAAEVLALAQSICDEHGIAV